MNDAPEKIWVDYSPHTESYGHVDSEDCGGYTEYTRSDIDQYLTVLPQEQFDNFLAVCGDTSSLPYNLAQARIEKLEAALTWISLGPSYYETPDGAVLEMMRVASEALKETP
jgi:hypothetical protein